MGNNKPIMKYRGFGSIGLQLAVWRNDKGCSYSIQKRFKAKDSDEWKDTNTLFTQDLHALKIMIDEAIKFSDAYMQKKHESNEVNSDEPIIEFNDDDIPF
jgi:hypothetical protein